MEIERKFLISKENLPADLNSYPHHRLEQGYLSTAPVAKAFHAAVPLFLLRQD